MPLFSKGKALVAVFAIVAATYAVLVVNAALVKKSEVENFEVSTEVSADYDGRKQVITLFDSMFRRKPTPDEIEKYASFGSRKAIMNAVLADYDKLEVIGQSAATQPKADPLPPAPAPAPAPAVVVVDAFNQADSGLAPIQQPQQRNPVADKIAAFEAAWLAIKQELQQQRS